jgi:hypothetical protein
MIGSGERRTYLNWRDEKLQEMGRGELTGTEERRISWKWGEENLQKQGRGEITGTGERRNYRTQCAAILIHSVSLSPSLYTFPVHVGPPALSQLPVCPHNPRLS